MTEDLTLTSPLKPTADFAEPLAAPTYMEPDLPSLSLPTTSALDNQPPEESISILTSMGFPRHHTIQALKATVSVLPHLLHVQWPEKEFGHLKIYECHTPVITLLGHLHELQSIWLHTSTKKLP